MLSRWELETLLGTKLTDEQWKENQRIFAEAQNEMWEQDHPLEE